MWMHYYCNESWNSFLSFISFEANNYTIQEWTSRYPYTLRSLGVQVINAALFCRNWYDDALNINNDMLSYSNGSKSFISAQNRMHKPVINTKIPDEKGITKTGTSKTKSDKACLTCKTSSSMRSCVTRAVRKLSCCCWTFQDSARRIALHTLC